MSITLEKSPFLQPVTDLLRELDKTGFFSHGLLIGSWPMIVYSEYFTLPYGLATNDIDFAVDNAVKVPAIGGETISPDSGAIGIHRCSGLFGYRDVSPGNF